MLDQAGKLEYLKNYRDRRLRTGVEQGWLSKAGLERFNQAYYREFATVTNGQAPRDPEVVINTLEAQRLAGDEDRKDLADAGIWFKTKDESLKQNVADPDNLDALANVISGKQDRDTVVYGGKVFAPQKLFELPKEEFAKKVHQTPGASNESKARLLAAYDDYKENGISPYAALSPSSDNAGARGLAVSAGQIPELFYGTVGLIGDTLERTIGKGASLRDWGFKGYQEWSEKLQPFSRDTDKWEGMWAKLKQGDAGALVDWAEYNAGYAIGQILEAGATALIGMGAGAVVGGAVEPIGGEIVGAAGGGLLGIFAKQGLKAGVKKAVEKAVYNIAKEEVVTELAKQGLRKGTKEGAEALAKRLAGEQFTKRLASEEFRKMATKKIYTGAGALASMQAYNMQMEAGSIYGALREKTKAEGRTPTDAEIGKAWGWAVAASAMETIGDKIGIDLLHGTYGAILGRSRGAAAAMGGLNGIVGETITEGVQTIFERWGAGQKAFDEEGVSDITNSMIGGAFGGGISGVSGGLMHGHPAARTKEEVAKEEFQAAPEQEIAKQTAPNAPESTKAMLEVMGTAISSEALGQAADVVQGASKGEKEPLLMDLEYKRVTWSPKNREPVTGTLIPDDDGTIMLIELDDGRLVPTDIAASEVEPEAVASAFNLARAPEQEAPIAPDVTPSPEATQAKTLKDFAPDDRKGRAAYVHDKQDAGETLTREEYGIYQTEDRYGQALNADNLNSYVSYEEFLRFRNQTEPVEPSAEPAAQTEQPTTETQQSDEQIASELNKSIHARTQPGDERGAAYKERADAAKRLIKTVKPGDKIVDSDGLEHVVESVSKNGDIYFKGDLGVTEKPYTMLMPERATTAEGKDIEIAAGRIVRGTTPAPSLVNEAEKPTQQVTALVDEYLRNKPKDVREAFYDSERATIERVSNDETFREAYAAANEKDAKRIMREWVAAAQKYADEVGGTVDKDKEGSPIVVVPQLNADFLNDPENFFREQNLSMIAGPATALASRDAIVRSGEDIFTSDERAWLNRVNQVLGKKQAFGVSSKSHGADLTIPVPSGEATKVEGQGAASLFPKTEAQGMTFTEPDNRTQAEKDAEAGQTRLDIPKELQHLAAPNASPAAKRALNNGNGDVMQTAKALAQYMDQEKEPEAKAKIEQELLQIPGVTKIPTAQNVEFSGEAGHVTAEGEDQLFKGDPADIIEPGYRFNDTIILPAKARRAQNAQTETPTGPQPQEGAVAENQAVQPDTREPSLAKQLLADANATKLSSTSRDLLIRAVAANNQAHPRRQPSSAEDALQVFQRFNAPLELTPIEEELEQNYVDRGYTPQELAADSDYRRDIQEIRDGLNKLRAAAGMSPLAKVALTEPTSPLENAEPLTPQGMWTEFLRDQDKGNTDDIILGAAQDPLEYGGDETVKRIDTKDAVAALREVYFDDNQVLDRDLEDAVTSLMGEIGVEPDANGVYEVDEAQLEQWKESPAYIARTGKKKKGRRKTRGLDTSLNTEEVVGEVTGDNPTTDPATLADRLGVSMREAGRRIQSALRELRGVFGTQRMARALNRVHGANQTSARFAGNFGLHPANNAFAALLPPMSTDEQDVVIRALGLDMEVPKPRIIPMPKGGWKVSKKLGLDKAQVRAVMTKVPWLNKVLRLGSLDTRSPGKFLKVLSAIKGDIPPQLHTNLANLASNLESAQDRFGLRVSEHEVPASERASYAQRTFKGRARQGQVVAAKLRHLHTWPGVSGFVGDQVAALNGEAPKQAAPLIITREKNGAMPTVLAGSQDWAAQMLANPDGKLDVIEVPQSTEELFGKEAPRTFGREMEPSQADLQNRKSGFTVFAPKLLPDELRATPGLPQDAGSNPSGAFQSAADLCGRVHQAVSRAAIKDAPVGSAEKKALLEAIRTNEQKQLRKWAEDNGLMLDAAEFERNWKAQGKLGESEHDLYIDGDTVLKRNVAGRGLAFATYLDYFQRNILFNRYFPDTAVSLRGFVEKDGVLMPVIEQRMVDIDTTNRVTEAEVDALMATIRDSDGQPIFRKAGRDKYISRDGLIEISDMHDENVVRTKTGSIVVIDNDINLRTQTGRQANNATPTSTFKVPELLLRSCRTVRDFAGLFVGYPNPFQALARSILASGHPLTAGFSVENDLAGNGLYNPVIHHAAIKSGASLLAGWHELGHSVTDRALHLASPDLTELEGDHAAYVAKLEEIVGDTSRPDYLRETSRLLLAAAAAEGQTKAIATKRATGRNYAYRTIHEFVAESFSNQAYQTRLQAIPDPDRTQSLWDSFKNFVRRMFGLPERYVSLFDSVMEATDKTIAADARLGDRVFESETDYRNAGRFTEPTDTKAAYRAAFKDWMTEQAKWMVAQATAFGYSSPDEYDAAQPGTFERLATEYTERAEREGNPKPLLSDFEPGGSRAIARDVQGVGASTGFGRYSEADLRVGDRVVLPSGTATVVSIAPLTVRDDAGSHPATVSDIADVERVVRGQPRQILPASLSGVNRMLEERRAEPVPAKPSDVARLATRAIAYLANNPSGDLTAFQETMSREIDPETVRSFLEAVQAEGYSHAEAQREAQRNRAIRNAWARKLAEQGVPNTEIERTLNEAGLPIPAKDLRGLVEGVTVNEVPSAEVDRTKPDAREVLGLDTSLNAVSAETDRIYLELARNPAENEAELQRMIDEAARKAGYDLSHRRRSKTPPWKTGHPILLTSDFDSNRHYGSNDYRFRSDDLSALPDWAVKWYSETRDFQDWADDNNVPEESRFEEARSAMQPMNIVSSGEFWDDSESVSAFWRENEDRLIREGIVGFRTPNGGVIIDPETAQKRFKSADPVTYFPGSKKPVPLSQRFNTKSESILETSIPSDTLVELHHEAKVVALAERVLRPLTNAAGIELRFVDDGGTRVVADTNGKPVALQINARSLASGMLAHGTEAEFEAALRDGVFREEMDHVASMLGVKPEDIVALMDSMDEGELTRIANSYYSVAPTPTRLVKVQEMMDRVMAEPKTRQEREERREARWQLGSEYLRMIKQRLELGATTESIALDIRSKPRGVVDTIVRYLKRLLTRWQTRYQLSRDMKLAAAIRRMQDVQRQLEGKAREIARGERKFDPASVSAAIENLPAPTGQTLTEPQYPGQTMPENNIPDVVIAETAPALAAPPTHIVSLLGVEKGSMAYAYLNRRQGMIDTRKVKNRADLERMAREEFARRSQQTYQADPEKIRSLEAVIRRAAETQVKFGVEEGRKTLDLLDRSELPYGYSIGDTSEKSRKTGGVWLDNRNRGPQWFNSRQEAVEAAWGFVRGPGNYQTGWAAWVEQNVNRPRREAAGIWAGALRRGSKFTPIAEEYYVEALPGGGFEVNTRSGKARNMGPFATREHAQLLADANNRIASGIMDPKHDFGAPVDPFSANLTWDILERSILGDAKDANHPDSRWENHGLGRPRQLEPTILEKTLAAIQTGQTGEPMKVYDEERAKAATRGLRTVKAGEGYRWVFVPGAKSQGGINSTAEAIRQRANLQEELRLHRILLNDQLINPSHYETQAIVDTERDIDRVLTLIEELDKLIENGVPTAPQIDIDPELREFLDDFDPDRPMESVSDWEQFAKDLEENGRAPLGKLARQQAAKFREAGAATVNPVTTLMALSPDTWCTRGEGMAREYLSRQGRKGQGVDYWLLLPPNGTQSIGGIRLESGTKEFEGINGARNGGDIGELLASHAKRIVKLAKDEGITGLDTRVAQAAGSTGLATSLDIGSPLSREQRMPFWWRGFDLLTGRLKTGKYQAGGRNTAAGKFDIRTFRLKETANQKAAAAARRCEYFAADLTRLFKKFPAVTQETVNTALGNLDNALSDQDVLDLENMERTGLRNIQQTFRTTMQGLRTLRQQIRTIHHNYSALTALQQGILSAEQTRDQSIKDLHDTLALEEGARKQARRDAARVAKAQAQASLPLEMRNAVQKFSDALATLELELFSSGALSPNLKAAVAANWDIWFHRSYAIFDTPRYVDWLQGNFPNLRTAVAAAAAASPNATVPDNVRVIRTALDRVRVDLTRRMIQQGTKMGLSLAQATADAQAFFQTAAGFDRISEYMEDLMTVADGDTTSFLQGTWSGKKSIEHLMPRGNIPEEYRALWGEHKDARVNAAKSLSLLAGHLANHQFLTDLRELGVSEGWITEPGVRPNPEGQLLVAEDPANPKWSPLAGCHGPAMLRDALKGSMDSRNLPWIYRQMLAATGLAMSAKTVLYWAGGVRNFVGNLAPAAANGYIRLYSGDWWSDFGHSGGATLSSIWDGGTEAARQDILELISLGVLGEANVEGVLRELMTPGMEARKLSHVGKTERAANVLWSRLAGAAQKGFQTAVRGYSFADEIWKMVAFKTELKYRQAIYGNTKSLESIKRETAEVIKKTLPTYSRSTEAIKAIRRIPIAAPFITFTGAVYNILAGTIQVGMNDIITGREIGNKALEAHGKARLFSFVATMATISALPILGRMILSALDPDDPYDQDDDDALRQHVPDWEKNAGLIPLWRDKVKKQVGYFNLTFSNMYDVVMRPFRSLGRDIRKGSNIGETLGNFALEFSDPLPREQIFLGSLMDAARGVDSTGKTVWTQNQSKGEKIAAGLEHVWKSAFMPQTIRSVQDMSKSVRGVVSSSGKAYEPVNAFFSGLLGLKIQDTNVATTLGYAGNAFRMNVRDAAYTFTRKLGSEGTVTDSELKDAYVQSNRQFLEAYKKIARKADAAKKLLHMTDQEIALILEAHGVPRAQVANILTNTYPRYEPSKKMMEKAIALDARGRKIPQNRVALLNEFRALVPDYQPILPK